MEPIPADSVFGIPASIESLAKSTLISAEGKVEALKDFYTKNETFTVHDSLGEFLEYFLGKEIVEKQIAPVLSGVYSGTLNDLPIADTLPYLIEYKEKYGSIIKGFAANKEKFKADGKKKFLSFKNGLSTIIQKLAKKLNGVEIRTNRRAIHIEKENGQFRVEYANGEEIFADNIVLAIPYQEAARLIPDKRAQELFNELKAGSAISVYLCFDLPDEKLPLEGTGFIVSKAGDLNCAASTWTSRNGNIHQRTAVCSSAFSIKTASGIFRIFSRWRKKK